VRPLRALNSTRAFAACSGGSASPQTLRPFSFQQYSFFCGALSACATHDAAVRPFHPVPPVGVELP
jgi:hypothetical protein